MSLKSAWALARRGLVVLIVFSLVMVSAGPTWAGLLPFEEEDEDSDLVVSALVVGNYDADFFGAAEGRFEFTGIATGFDLGPGAGNDYTGFAANVSLTGVGIDSSGNVTQPGSFTVTYTNPPGTSLATDFSLAPGDLMLVGHVLEVLLDTTETMQIAIEITGGNTAFVAAMTDPSLPFVGIKMTNPGLPGNFSGDFSVDDADTDIVGPIPEPGSVVLGLIGAVLTMVRRSRQRDY